LGRFANNIDYRRNKIIGTIKKAQRGLTTGVHKSVFVDKE
jgi:hypothetical protein